MKKLMLRFVKSKWAPLIAVLLLPISVLLILILIIYFGIGDMLRQIAEQFED